MTTKEKKNLAGQEYLQETRRALARLLESLARTRPSPAKSSRAGGDDA